MTIMYGIEHATNGSHTLAVLEKLLIPFSHICPSVLPVTHRISYYSSGIAIVWLS